MFGRKIYVVVALQVEKELVGVCEDVLKILDKCLIANATSGESKVFYFKM